MLSFNVKSTGPGLKIRVSVDEVPRYELEVPQNDLLICLNLPSHDSSLHTISLEMWGKLPEHTVLDAEGNIVSDRGLEFQDFAYYNVPLGWKFLESASYYHDRNGNAELTCQAFGGYMYFNGRVEWQYDQDPLLWLLELT